MTHCHYCIQRLPKQIDKETLENQSNVQVVMGD